MHPYSQLDDSKFWNSFASSVPWRDLNIVDRTSFKISKNSKIATAGSCFAQHTARYLRKYGISPYRTEQIHPISQEFGSEIDSYNCFSARYGNIYTVRQCLELVQQAFGKIRPIEDFHSQEGRVYDLMRPKAIPNGFMNFSEARADRMFHLARVRQLFISADVFIFTMGLTESWYHERHRYTYPVCPGTARGKYDESIHKFRNFTYEEVRQDTESLIQELFDINPALKIVMTVSPVPLMATRSKSNVLLASSYSKAILRAVCGEMDNKFSHVQYFPSFEIISHVASFGQYLTTGLREVSERGIAHSMDAFFKAYIIDGNDDQINLEEDKKSIPKLNEKESMEQFIQEECDEVYNDPTFNLHA